MSLQPQEGRNGPGQAAGRPASPPRSCQPGPQPLLFVSHSGADTEAALELSRRIEASPEAREHGLTVWIDKKDLLPGPRWKDQLQGALARSTAFAVYVGSRGVVNWVWDEVSVALDRAHQAPGYPVIPVLAPAADLRALPSFLTQYQGVRDVERDAEAFAQLLRGVLRLEARAPIEAEREPFQGLEAFDSGRAHLFFGREEETKELVELLRTMSLVMVVGDSGSGKSSLVKAGLVPRFRGGALGRPSNQGPDDTLWHVVEARPLRAPFDKLAEAVRDAARTLGRPPKECSDLAELVRTKQASQIQDAIQMSGPPGAKTLLVVDQFEELFTLTETADQAAFVDALLTLADRGDDTIRVVLTMRWDYYHLCSSVPRLYERLEARQRRARYTLPRMEPAGLGQAITRPLALAGVREDKAEALARAVLRDVAERPNDLALLEMALTRTWAKRAEHDGDLLRTYEVIGRVDGALATAAEEVITTLPPAERELAEPLFIRLVKLGETGGATRRSAAKDELEGGRWDLAQRLATKECERLVVVKGETVEIAHEALVTSWPRYAEWLRNDTVRNDRRADDKRRLDTLVEDARRWAEASPDGRPKFLARGYDLESYEGLKSDRPAWLCRCEVQFIETSAAERDAEAHRRVRTQRRLLWASLGAALFFLALAVVLGIVAWGPLKREWVRRTLASEITWEPVPAPSGGQFQMGCVPGDRECLDNEKRHPVALSRSFKLMAREVTVAQFRRFIAAQRRDVAQFMATQPDWNQGDKYPVVNIDWWDATAFCAFVGGRLPTEAEWEYAARGGSADTIYPWGNEYSQDQANGTGVGGKDKWEQTAPVGSFEPNGFKLYDMVGNVWEWTASVYRDYPYRGDDGREDPASREVRGVRGGAWGVNPRSLRVSFRYSNPPTNRIYLLGFRCARDVSP